MFLSLILECSLRGRHRQTRRGMLVVARVLTPSHMYKPVGFGPGQHEQPLTMFVCYIRYKCDKCDKCDKQSSFQKTYLCKWEQRGMRATLPSSSPGCGCIPRLHG